MTCEIKIPGSVQRIVPIIQADGELNYKIKIPETVQRIIPLMKPNSELSYMFTTVEGLMTQYRKAPSYPASIMYFNGKKIVMAVICPDQEV